MGFKMCFIGIKQIFQRIKKDLNSKSRIVTKYNLFAAKTYLQSHNYSMITATDNMLLVVLHFNEKHEILSKRSIKRFFQINWS
jgi:hypothetical protein